MPFVNITMAKGRTMEQKRAMAQSITDVVADCLDVDPEVVWIHIDEFDRENFATGGKLMADKR